MNRTHRILVFIVALLQPRASRCQLQCQSSERPLVMEFLPDDGAPLVVPLSSGLPFGSELSLEGSVPPGAQEFSVELLVPDDVEFTEQSAMAFSFHARFDVEQVYHNSFLKHAWGQQEIPYWFPLQADAEFNVSLQSDNQGFKVNVNGALFWMFFHRVDPSQVSHVRVFGDVSLYKLIYHVGAQQVCRPRADLRAQQLPVSGAVPYLSQLRYPFSTGSVISVAGTLHSNADWIIINLQSDQDNEEVIVLQFNARLKDGAVLHNTFFNGAWGWDFSNDSVPLQRGAAFTIDFHSEHRHIKVCANGALFSRYEHRLNPERVTMVLVNGALTLKSVLHYTNGTRADAPQGTSKTCSSLRASPSFKNILCQLCSHLPDPDLSVMATPLRFKRQP
ncbi:galectin-4-like isoform X2 [Zootermopsis nevadensis]|uniref:galectin-4-like isoform X2 n=1 Tax=Zootermopsis nevadensis TaxID=136037 RepID=UPI000B8E24D7|nr:galectin-4-like isoform X2 [Zootermopsis nevadensis]